MVHEMMTYVWARPVRQCSLVGIIYGGGKIAKPISSSDNGVSIALVESEGFQTGQIDDKKAVLAAETIRCITMTP
jgi:hypothetical protein